MFGLHVKAKQQGKRTVDSEQYLHNESRRTFPVDERDELQSNVAKYSPLNA